MARQNQRKEARAENRKPSRVERTTDSPQSADLALLQRAVTDPGAATADDVLALQNAYGNRAVSSLLVDGSPRTAAPHVRVQAKLAIGVVGDRYEREADRVAGQVMSMPDPVAAQPVQRQEDEEELQTKPLAASVTALVQRQEEEEEFQVKPLAQRQADGSFEASSGLEARLSSAQGGGSALSDDVREFMEPRFGVGFGDVRVHAGAEAAQLSRELSAQAFTHGSDVYFGAGQYDPGSDAGKRLLAHELTHVVQQTGRRPAPTTASSLNYGSGRKRSPWGAAQRAVPTNPFASRSIVQRPHVALSAATPDIQCYTKKVGNVRFSASSVNAAVARPLQIERSATDLTVSSQPFTATGRVVAMGPKAEVGQWKVGFLQTMFASEILEDYDTRPALKAGRLRNKWVMNPLPIRDGTAGHTPWYGAPGEAANPVHQFAASRVSGKDVALWDQPTSPCDWIENSGGKTWYLVRTSGKDAFRTWLAVRNSTTNQTVRLAWADWEVNYGTRVRVNEKSPQSSGVTKVGGTRITATGDGPGTKAPQLGDPVGNDSQTMTPVKW